MPFKSQAQRRKFAELLVEGKISPDTFEDWNRETGSKRLPEHVVRKRTTAVRKPAPKKPAPKKKTAAKSRTKTTAARRKRRRSA